MIDIQVDYGIPQDLMQFVDDGFLEVVTLRPSEKTVDFHIPSLRRTDERGRITTFDLTWIHPDFNSQFCHYYDQSPGDLPNFYLTKDTTDLGDAPIDLADLDELLCWLEETKSLVP